MKKKLIFIILITMLFPIIYFLNKDNNIVNIIIILNNNCNECTSLDSYLEVYKKAWVNFWDLVKIDSTSFEGKDYLQKYKIKKLPFIIFSKNLEKYKTIASSWNDTFGYRNDLWEYIPTDIIPPYFNIKTKKIEWLIDMIYIWNINCNKCYLLSDIKERLGTFWIKFNNILTIDNNSKQAIDLVNKYNIKVFPNIILSSNLSLYKNFSYFWKNLWTIEEDKKYILRKPANLGLKVQVNLN